MHGAIYWFLALGYILALPFVAEIFAPAFQKMKLVSAYEVRDVEFHYIVTKSFCNFNLKLNAKYMMEGYAKVGVFVVSWEEVPQIGSFA